jgi:uncharacterized protein YbjT (DUF2867 family)
MILVTGATGTVGRQVVSQLLGTGTAVRAVTRNPRAAGLPGGVDVVRADLAVPNTLNECLDGVETVFLVWPFLTAEAAPAVLEVVSRHARRIVYLSSMGVRDGVQRQTDQINQFHAEIEHWIERSGLEWTFLRAGGFAANTLEWAPQIRAEGVVRAPYGAAARSLIHERDIAAVAVRALTGDGHGSATYVLTGPQVLTTIEQVGTIGEVIGRSLRFEELPPEAARQQLRTWLPPSGVDGVLTLWAKMVTEPEPVTFTVEEVTGVPARTFRQWAIDHADDFR